MKSESLRCGARMRAAIAAARALLAQLETAATDAIAIGKRIDELQAASASSEGDDERRDRKLATCSALKRKLEAMNAATLFCESERELEEITRFAKLVQKKQAYRKKAKKRQRVVAAILRAMPIERTREFVDPETIDLKTLIEIRTAWDRFIVPPRTFPGSSTIPPHFVPPPATPSAQWAVYVNATRTLTPTL
ncbi:hypothetical protein PybrP1_010079 [[Pythium] brassicae (nom. inval.)]|nr:hypothetical protein PybrP1_010079 [[Pythium] brassicae (nom. inval.)]